MCRCVDNKGNLKCMYLYMLYSGTYRYECTQRLEKHIDLYLAKINFLVRFFQVNFTFFYV